jgi:PAS domain S-box-containing protein
LSIRLKLVTAFLSIMVPLGIVGTLAYTDSKELVAINRTVAHTQTVIAAAQELLQRVHAMESSGRGYLVSGDETFLTTYRDRRAQVLLKLALLRNLTADSPRQLERLGELESLLQAKITVMDRIAKNRRQGESIGSLVDELRTSRDLMFEIGTLAKAITDEESRLLAERQEQAERQARLTQLVILVGTAASLTFILVIGSVLANPIAANMRHLAASAARLGAGDLDTRVDLGNRRDELGALGTAFNRMADELQTRDKQLKASEEERDRFFSMALDMLCIAGLDGYFKRVNPAFTATLGYAQQEFLSTPFIDFIHPDDLPATRQAVESLSTGTAVIDFENRYRCKDGSWRWMAWKAVAAPAGLIYATARDVTEQKRLQDERHAYLQKIEEQNRELEAQNREVERATQMKSQFLASMSHELRTPLNAIMGFSELLEDGTAGVLNEKQQRFISQVRTGARHLLQLINDILDLSKIEAGQLDLHLEHFDLYSAVPEVISLIRPLAMSKRLTLDAPRPADEVIVYADRIRVKQIFYNLLSNAVKFTPPGGRVTLQVDVKQQVPVFVVSDTGVGIRPEDQEAIFEEFRQVGDEASRQQGTGLGLAITRRLVERQGGTIRVESEPGAGSHFLVTLPSGIHTSRPQIASENAPAYPAYNEPPDGRPVVLAIDDDPLARQLLASFLAPEGFDVRGIDGGEQALALARELQPDVITLDILMPLSGWNLLGKLKKDPDTSTIPVIVVSIVDEKSAGFALGAADYLVKPISREPLLQALRRVLVASQQPHRILVVDDNPTDLQVVSELLHVIGLVPIQAGGGAEGLSLLRSEQPDALLLDLMMPEIDGFDVLREMKQDPSLRAIPVFILTAKELSREEAETLSAHAQALLSKSGPWKEDLLAKLRTTLEVKKAPGRAT